VTISASGQKLSSWFKHLTSNKNHFHLIQYIEIRFLSKNKSPDVILCVLSEKFIETIIGRPVIKSDSDDDAVQEKDEILNPAGSSVPLESNPLSASR